MYIHSYKYIFNAMSIIYKMFTPLKSTVSFLRFYCILNIPVSIPEEINLLLFHTIFMTDIRKRDIYQPIFFRLSTLSTRI